MPFTHISEITSGSRIKAGWFLDLYNVLTGVMVDQPLTIGNNLTVTGTISSGGQTFQSSAVGSVALIAKGFSGQTADIFEVQDYQGNVQARVTSGGVLKAEQGVVIDAGGLTVTAGNTAVGAALDSSKGLLVGSAALTGTVQTGVQANISGTSAATSEIAGFYSASTTAAASFTATTVAQFHATNPAKGASSTITSAYGLVVDAQNQGSTNNYGIYINAPSGGSGTNASIYVNGGDSILGATGMATSATTGFPCFPSCAGTPTGTPTNAGITRPVVIDSTNVRLWVYVNGGWHYSALT